MENGQREIWETEGEKPNEWRGIYKIRKEAERERELKSEREWEKERERERERERKRKIEALRMCVGFSYKHTQRQTYIYIYKLATIVEGNPKAPFSIATTPTCRGGRYSFLGLLYFTLDT